MIFDKYCALNNDIIFYLDNTPFKSFNVKFVEDIIKEEDKEIYLATDKLCSDILKFFILYYIFAKDYKKIKDSIDRIDHKETMENILVDMNNIVYNNEYITYILNNSSFFKSDRWLDLYYSP
jgi:hypothetical protein